jgi:hypothetical protein
LDSIIVAVSKVIVGLLRYKNFPLLPIQRIIAPETTENPIPVSPTTPVIFPISNSTKAQRNFN